MKSTIMATKCATAFIMMTGLMFEALADYQDVDWMSLVPEAERAALLNTAPIDHAGGDTGPVAALGAGRTNLDQQAFEAAWFSSNVVAEFDGELVRMPGFVVPLEYDGRQQVTEFFLVPFFGACIHVPAPPPNQIVHVRVEGGFRLSSIYEPYVIEGLMQIETTARDIGISAYSVNADQVFPYRR